MSGITTRRQEMVREWLEEQGLDALLVSAEPNVRWLTGFAGEGLLVLDASGVSICTDSRYAIQARDEAPDAEVLADGGHLEQAIGRRNADGVGRFGFESAYLSYASHRKLCEGLDEAEPVPVEDKIKRLRAVKDEAEIALIEQAATIADRAFVALRPMLPGMCERDAAFELHRLMVKEGAEKPSFDIIVASGPNGAKPHACPCERRISEGDFIVIDWGAVVEGYCSDCTRTVIVGQPDGRQREIWEAVREAQLAAIAGVRPGAVCREVDEIARGLLRERGFDREFGHGLGHGVGLQVHELPVLSQRSEDAALEAGMVVTVEPGVYIEDWGGVRLEELVLVTQEGHRSLTAAPYDL